MSIMNILPLFAQGAIMEAYNLTDLDTALIIAVLAVVAFVVYELVHRYKNGSEPAEDDYADNKSASENVNEEENFKKEKTINVRVYQGENFVARAPDKDNPRVRLFDLDWCRCPLSNLEEMSCMQKVINAVNTRQMCSAIYYINKETKEMVVYSKADFLIWSDMPHPDDYMRMWLGNFFFLKQNFAVDLENEKQRVGIK